MSLKAVNKISKNQIKKLRALHHKKGRREQGVFLVEGEKMVVELLAAKWNVVELYGSNDFFQKYSSLVELSGFSSWLCSEAELTQISSLTSNNAAVAVVSMKAESMVEPHSSSWILAIDGINDPGNLGTILRVADWYGISQVVCSLTTVELYNPKVIAASKGSFLRVAVRYQELAPFLAKRAEFSPIFGAYLEGEVVHQLTLTQLGGVIVVGNEAQGISEQLAPYITRKITIPSFGGGAESLNVAMASAIICDNLQRLSQGC